MQLVRSLGPARRHCIASLAQITGLCVWVLAGMWGARTVAKRMMCGCGVSKLEIGKMGVDRLAHEAYPQWLADHPGLHCPRALGELAPYLDRRDIQDPWGESYVMTCTPALGPVIVSSAGEDGKFGTPDDLRSDLQ